jgi:hypothetical protein
VFNKNQYNNNNNNNNNNNRPLVRELHVKWLRYSEKLGETESLGGERDLL